MLTGQEVAKNLIAELRELIVAKTDTPDLLAQVVSRLQLL